MSSVQINKNTISEPHKDKNNIGLSVAFVLAGNSFHHNGSGAASGSGDIAPGNPGALFYSDTKDIIAKVNEMNIFDGKREHHAVAYNGDRYSRTFFTHKSFSAAKPEHKLTRRSMGYMLPDSEEEEDKPQAQKDEEKMMDTLWELEFRLNDVKKKTRQRSVD